MEQTSLTVATFNICLAPFFRRPYKRIAEFASRLPDEIDIINLQEVYTYDMLWMLRKALVSYSLSFKKGLYGPRSGLVTLSRVPLEQERFIALPKQKGILLSRLASGIVIANIHLATNTDGDWSRDNRYFKTHKNHLDQLNQELVSEDRVILGGDFNLAKTSDLYCYFKSKGNWIDAHKQDISPTFHKEFLPNDREPQRIDYIFTRGNVASQTSPKIFESKIDGQYLSNHIGLMANLQIKSE